MNQILDKLKLWQSRESIKGNYLSIWRQFNAFTLKLDKKPKSWEHCMSLYGAYLFEQGIKSTTLHSYVSAAKHVLTVDGYKWDNDLISLNTLVNACKIRNDIIKAMLPIHINLLEILMFELERIWSKSPYLEIMYKALFLLAYYGLMRISEVVGIHAVKAKNVHIGSNKNKILLILYSSKTHSKESLPQKIKISEDYDKKKIKSNHFFCPFKTVRKFVQIRGPYDGNENFFVFADGTQVQPFQVRTMLKRLIKTVNLDCSIYCFQGIQAGRATDLRKMGYTVDEIKELGRWKSNAVYRYLKL